MSRPIFRHRSVNGAQPRMSPTIRRISTEQSEGLPSLMHSLAGTSKREIHSVFQRYFPLESLN